MDTSVAAASYDFKQIDALIAAYLAEVEAIMQSYSASDVQVVQDVVEHLLRSGGKRIRLKLVILAACACGLDTDAAEVRAEVCEAATVMEFIHSATLLHDDVVDDAETRRHHQAARMKWGNEASVLVGDFMYSRAFQLLATRNNTPLMHLLAKATAQLSEGEVHQLTQLREHSTTEASYYKVIAAKTGALFAASCQAGAMLLDPDNPELQQAMHAYGMNLGIAFQIMDDILDYSADAQALGKVVGKDLMEGKITLPLIYALADANATEKELLLSLIENPDGSKLPQVLALMSKYESLAKAQARANEFADKAQHDLLCLGNSQYKNILHWLADFACNRSY